MKEMPQHLRSYAPPTRDKIVIWCAVAAGCAVMALLLRQIALSKFGFDTFAANVSFCIALLLLGGLYASFQNNLEQLIAKMTFKNQSQELQLAFSQDVPESVGTDMVEAVRDQDLNSHDLPFEIVEVYDEDNQLIQFPDGMKLHVSPKSDPKDIMSWKEEHDERDYDSELEAMRSNYEGDECEEEAPRYYNGKRVIRYEREENPETGCFAQHATLQEDFENPDIIREYVDTVYITAEGEVYGERELDELIEFYNTHKDIAEKHGELIDQHRECHRAYEQVKKEDEMLNIEQITFICAYLTHTMASFMESHELSKLHHNAKIWTIDAVASFHAVQLQSDHLSKEDLKHVGYNIGKFLGMSGEVIARFVKTVFEEPFSTLQLRTIVAKLADRDPKKDRIPLYSAKEMHRLFSHYRKYGKINTKILA